MRPPPPPPPLPRRLAFALSRVSQKDQPPPPPTPNDPEGWVLGGLPKDEESEAFKRRNKHKGSRHFTLSNDLLQRLPKVDREGLEAVRDCVDGKGAALPFRFFKEAFPEECQDIVIDEVRGCLEFMQPRSSCWRAFRDRVTGCF